MRQSIIVILLAGAALTASPAIGQSTITERSVAAHEHFLASDALQGRGSATRDEAIAAAYVASRFEAYGLTPAPGMSGYLQTATIVKQQLGGPVTLVANGAPVAQPTMLAGSGKSVSGKLAVANSVKDLPKARVVLLTASAVDAMQLFRAAREKQVALVLIRESDATRKLATMINAPRLPSYLDGEAPEGGPTVVTLPDSAVDALASKSGTDVTLTVAVSEERSPTTNAVGYLPGSDPSAGALLFSAHLDHLGRRPDGTIMYGANDDASGTTAVLELAEALAGGKQPKRSILFVAYGSEEIGGYGSTYFAKHPPVPLDRIIANVEFEMIGAQDPKLPTNTMMTGFDRSKLGAAMKQHGALVTGDPYPEQHFFERSDNYALALKGVVAHTAAGWGTPPTYHQPDDDLEHLDLPFMTAAIQSLVEPVRWLADSDFMPAWNKDGQPKPRE